jgi:hypothetical protein
MTHSDKGNYAAKHGPEGRPDERIAAALRAGIEEGSCDCARAERVGSDLEVPLAEVGRALDLMEIRISRCQLGLFGYDDGASPNGRIVQPATAVSEELERAIRGGLAVGKLPCRNAWGIAATLKVPRLAVAAACEALKIRIKPCQLGAF